MPRLAHDSNSDLATFSTPADGFGNSGNPGSDETPLSVTTLKSSALEKIQEFLIRGERREACHYALDEKLWSHAMVIASSIDRDTWQETVREFIRADLGSKDVQDDKVRANNLRRGSLITPASNGRESLRVAYSLFAGQGATSGITFPSQPRQQTYFFDSSPRNASSRHTYPPGRQQTRSSSVRPPWRHAGVS